jgi:hypothetical protein
MKKLIFALFFLVPSLAFAGGADIEYQYDSRGWTVLNFEGHSDLPFGFKTWGFIDIESNRNNKTSEIDLDNYFFEIDLKRPIWKGIGPIAEWNDGGFQGDNTGRFGVSYDVESNILNNLNSYVGVKLFPLSTDSGGKQISFYGGSGYKRFSLDSFIDINFLNGKSKIVSETTFRYKLYKGISAISEIRYNEFIVNNEFGVSVGAEYRF